MAGAGAGVAMGVFLWFLAVPLAQGTSLPLAMVRLVGVMFPLAMLRPVFLGYLQGQGRFSTYGAVSLVYALARLAFIAIGRKVGMLDPFWVAQSLLWAMALVVILGLLLAHRDLFQRGRLAWPLMWQGWRLSLVVLIVSTAFMALTNLDVVWVHRFWPQMAGAYARVVVLRRIVSFMPLAVGIVLLPRMAALGADRRRTRRLVFFAAGIVLANGVLLTSLYGLYGGTIDRLVFGADVPAPASWFVGMALAATGFGLVTIWINVFLATKPFPFGYILLVAALVQGISYGLLGRTPESIIALWAFSGWLLALVGAGLYGWQSRSPVDSARSLPITL